MPRNSAEPGIFFIDNANKMTNATAYGQKVVATNPLCEQPLTPYAVCNLAAVNLANMAGPIIKRGQLILPKLRERLKPAVFVFKTMSLMRPLTSLIKMSSQSER